MKLSPNLTRLIAQKGTKILGRSWIMRLYSPTKNLLGVSSVFKLPCKLHFQILQTGILDHGIMTCVAVSMVEHLKQITRQLKKMRKAGKSAEEMLNVVSGVDLDSPKEISKDFIVFTCGNIGEDLNVSSLYLLAGNTLTIDHMEIK